MAQSQQTLLEEIAKKLRKLECICSNTASTSSAIVEDYQPLSCNGSPIGDPINVMPIISVAKTDVSICNVQELAAAIAIGGDEYDVAFMDMVPIDTAWTLASLNLDVTKLHSISFTVISGTLDISGDLGGGVQTGTALPKGTSSGWTISTTFGTGDIEFTTTGGTTLITATQKA